jgi:HlyD family secretion protein
MNLEWIPAPAGQTQISYVGGQGADDRQIDDPRREIRFGIMIAVLFFVGLVGWAAIARMDAAAYAEGRLAVSGQRQAVQHRDGGVVGAIFVKEGQRVARGQVLLQLAAADVLAQERALSSQAIGLHAQRARLRSEQLGFRHIEQPVEFAALTGLDRAEAAGALRLQQAQLRTRTSVLAAQKGALGQRTAQLSQEARGYRSQVTATTEQETLIEEELEGLRKVAEKGFVSQNRIRALERAKAELEGRRGQYGATIAQSGESAGENRLRILELERSHQEKVATELRDVEFALNDVLPKLNAARDQLARTRIHAPVTGTVVGLTVFTVGGVIAPGQKLMDIVPDSAPLLIEARVSPNDADDLAVGQMTYVRFDSLHERSLPNLEGRLTRLSADSFVDERTGESFFTAEVTIPLDQLQLIKDRRGQDFALRAGMPVQVLVPLRKRTALQYAFEPLTQGMWKSFREQ